MSPKRLSLLALLGFLTLAFTPLSAGAQNRTVATYEGGYLISSTEPQAPSTASCPRDSHVCEHTYREYGPDGLVKERTYKHCIPQGRSADAQAYAHGTQYDEWDYRYGPPPIQRPVRQRTVYRTPAVVHSPPVYYSRSPYYSPGYGSYVAGDTLLGGALGAAAGAAIGAVVGDPGAGAAIGAVVGGFNGFSRGAFGHGLLW